MNNAQSGDPSNTAFDLFDRWMTNREPQKDAGAETAVGEVVISDTKSSREAARKLLESIERSEREAAEQDTTATVAPVAAPEPIADPEPVTEPVQTWNPPTPEPIATPVPVGTPSSPVAPGGGKRRAAVPTDSASPLNPVADPSAGNGKHAAPIEAPTPAATFTIPQELIAPPAPPEPPIAYEPEPEPEPSHESTSTAPPAAFEASLPTEGRDGGPHLRLIVTGLMVAAILGVGSLGYFLYAGHEWALKPAASMSALTVFLVATRFSGHQLT